MDFLAKTAARSGVSLSFCFPVGGEELPFEAMLRCQGRVFRVGLRGPHPAAKIAGLPGCWRSCRRLPAICRLGIPQNLLVFASGLTVRATTKPSKECATAGKSLGTLTVACSADRV